MQAGPRPACLRKRRQDRSSASRGTALQQIAASDGSMIRVSGGPEWEPGERRGFERASEAFADKTEGGRAGGDGRAWPEGVDSVAKPFQRRTPDWPGPYSGRHCTSLPSSLPRVYGMACWFANIVCESRDGG